MLETKTTTDYDEIKAWARRRDAKPAAIMEENDIVGSLQFIMPDVKTMERVGEISWDEWFEKFEREELAFLYLDASATGDPSNYHQFVKRVGGELSDLTKIKTTTSLKEIKDWAHRRGAIPASIKGSEDENEVAGILTFDFSGDESLEPLAWTEFQDKFEKEKLGFQYKELESDGTYSHWFEFENRT